TIRPYTDLLLHDMGEGLADGRPDYLASGRQWRTPPLWGLGLLPVASEHGTLLHDGRARNPLEAILWHGGEASTSREALRAMEKADREALLAFLASL
ncbi:thiol oxidoreductase, partial [Azoarcus sp. TTM-91]|uniref:di-heme oxidoredictase family protein n=1 Tax=Azoarcus sp. TTM-91 TaxID=2691581 RepID=UPI0016B3147F